MTRRLWTGTMLGCLALVWFAMHQGGSAVQAQTTEQVTLSAGDLWHGRAFLLAVQGQGIVDQSGWWHVDTSLQTYAKAHRDATFLLFTQGGFLYRLDTPAALQRLAEIHEPLDDLGTLQEQLSHLQAPLAEQQKTLSAHMRATSSPRDMGRIGREMGVIGRQQGVIGMQQGAIGREQGRLGRAFYQSTQELIDKCLADKSCYAVGPAEPATAQR